MSHQSFQQEFGDYLLQEQLGKGGMGTVYRAFEKALNRPVAIKVMNREYQNNPKTRDRFIQEAQTIAQLNHPNIITIHAFGEFPELHIVMEYVPIGSLRHYLKQPNKVMSVYEALTLSSQVADALHQVHSLPTMKIIHRDVKPDNVLLKTVSRGPDTDIYAVLTDFGVVKVADGSNRTQLGIAVGTFPYMSPEQLQGKKDVDWRTDIYSLGVMIYQLVVGQLPYPVKNYNEAVEAHRSDPPAPATLRAGITPRLQSLILRAIAKNPNDRFQTALELSDELKSVLSIDGDHLRQMDTNAKNQQKLRPLTEHISTVLRDLPPELTMPPPSSPTSLDRDRIVIRQRNEADKTIEIRQDVLTIGRSSKNDIVLSSEGVSGKHAKIERQSDGSYIITDLGSRNGTFMNRSELLSNIAQEWLHDQTVEIDEYQLILQLPRQLSVGSGVRGTGYHPDAFVQQDTAPTRSLSPNAPMFSTEGGVYVSADQSALRVAPGLETTLSLKVTNPTANVVHVSAAVNIPNNPVGWFTPPPSGLQLMPQESQSLDIRFHPPRDPSSVAGDHRITIDILDTQTGQPYTRVSITLTIDPFYNFSTDLFPSNVAKGTTTLTINNDGNSRQQFTILPRDEAASLRFMPYQDVIELQPGQTHRIPFAIHAPNQALVGTPNTFPFTITVQTPNAKDIKHGKAIVKPKIPIWLVSLIPVLCIACAVSVLALGQFWPGDDDPESDELTVEARVEASQTADALALAPQQTQQFLETEVAAASESTAIVLQATQTSVALTANAPPTINEEDSGTGDSTGTNAGGGESNDQCPADPNKTSRGICGCGVPDTDSDGDGIADCQDQCEADPNKTAPGTCGCGVVDIAGDADRDGTADCVDPSPMPAPLVHLSFDGDIADHSSNALTTIQDGSVQFVGGVEGLAGSFDGSGENVEITNSSNLPAMNEMTLEFWVNMSNWSNPYQGSAHIESIVSRGVFYTVHVNFDTWQLGAQISTENTDLSGVSLQGGQLQPGRWHHVALVYSGSESSARLYLDGQLVAQTNVSGRIVANSSVNLTVGTWFEQNQAFAGMVDEVNLYNVAASDYVVQLLAE